MVRWYEMGQIMGDTLGATAQDVATPVRWLSEQAGAASVQIPLSQAQVGDPYSQVNRGGPVQEGTVGPAIGQFWRGLTRQPETDPVVAKQAPQPAPVPVADPPQGPGPAEQDRLKLQEWWAKGKGVQPLDTRNNQDGTAWQDAQVRKAEEDQYAEQMRVQARKTPAESLDGILRRRSAAMFEGKAQLKNEKYYDTTFVQSADKKSTRVVQKAKSLADINPLDLSEKDIPKYLTELEDAYSKVMPNAMRNPHVQAALFDLGQSIRAHQAQKLKIKAAENDVSLVQKRIDDLKGKKRAIMQNGGMGSGEDAWYDQQIEKVTQAHLTPAQLALQNERLGLSQREGAAAQAYQGLRSGASYEEDRIQAETAQAQRVQAREAYFDERRVAEDMQSQYDRMARESQAEETAKRKPYKDAAGRVKVDLDSLTKRIERLQVQMDKTPMEEDKVPLQEMIDDLTEQQTAAQEEYDGLYSQSDPQSHALYSQSSQRYKNRAQQEVARPVQTRALY